MSYQGSGLFGFLWHSLVSSLALASSDVSKTLTENDDEWMNDGLMAERAGSLVSTVLATLRSHACPALLWGLSMSAAHTP